HSLWKVFISFADDYSWYRNYCITLIKSVITSMSSLSGSWITLSVLSFGISKDDILSSSLR
ncbi:MAG: hypothetical protein PUC07_07690, partial [Solobacterium sp.]|nr:hypothetical protein [Solobacterium sp.]